jgi:DNA-binding transcriptional LysR family regulator
MAMELRHIRYFLAVAEDRNFTRAAARLGIGQPPLSLQIKDLEAEMGVQLFYRLPHGAELTEAGLAFLEAVQAIPKRAADAVCAAQRAARGETGHLGLGITGTAALNPIVPASIRAFRRNFPDVELSLEESNTAMLLAGLLERRLDAVIFRPGETHPEGLRIQHLADEPLVVALPAAHAAAKERRGVSLEMLRNDPLISTLPATYLRDTALRACRNAGFEPVLGLPAPHIASILSLVSAEFGISLVPSCIRQLNVKGVVYRTILAPGPRVGIAIAFRESRSPQHAANFGKLARIAARKSNRPGTSTENV